MAPPHALETVRGRKETGYKDRIYMGGAQDEIEGVISMHIGKVVISSETKGREKGGKKRKGKGVTLKGGRVKVRPFRWKSWWLVEW